MAATQPPKHLSHLLRMLKTKGRYCKEQNLLTIQLLKNITLTLLNSVILIDLSFFCFIYLVNLGLFSGLAKDWLG